MSDPLITTKPETITDAGTLPQASIQHYIASLMPGAKRQYDRNVNRDLSQQNASGTFERNIIAVLNETYEAALKHLQRLPAGTIESSATEIRHSFDEFIAELIQYALQKHRSSCALSNFPQEHNPAKDYISAVLTEVQAEWNRFVLQIQNMSKH